MAVTHAPAGFTGTVDQIDEARRFALGGGGRFRANSAADWALTANAATRTVNIAAGMAEACGVIDITTAADTVTFAANGGGSNRYDAVVATFDWVAATISFRVIQGTTVVPTIVRTGTTVDATKINWLPGIRYDAVLGVIAVRPGVTTLAPADLYDVRLWGSWSKLNVASASFGGVLDADVGGKMMEVSTGHTWEWTGPTYGWVQSPALVFGVFGGSASGFTAVGTAGVGVLSAGPIATHAPGVLRVRIYGTWVSGVTCAGSLRIGVSPTSAATGIVLLSGSDNRIHNFSETTAKPYTCEGYYDSDGVAGKYLWLLGDTDNTSSGGFQVLVANWAVFRL